MICEKCGKNISQEEANKIVFYEFKHVLTGWEDIARIDLCKDCGEKALVVLADALELEKPKLYNVYAWEQGHSAVRVLTGVPIEQASDCVDIYLKRGLEWDAYLVEQSDDPGWPDSEPSSEK